jgi:uncharacterized protein YpbB
MQTVTDTANTVFLYAVNFINQTSTNIFLTGKAGTGKTTFLRYIREHTYKKMAIAAPTGVAAINAGGVTIHSLFQIPPATFLPTTKHTWGDTEKHILNKHSLLSGHRMAAARRALLQELDLLVIDEISMVRADMLDAIDTILQSVRNNSQPFGGVQVLFIGDMYQLPPVVKPGEWELLQEYYDSIFFFDAQVLKQNQPLFLELTRIYRQKDAGFIGLLNNIRNNTVSAGDLELLHRYYRPDFTPFKEDNYITLTSHNYKANEINRRELNNLPAAAHRLRAEVEGEFFDNAFPADEVLELKEGAQIMFIKNDKGEARRYYNGKIGLVEKITEEKIRIRFPAENTLLELEKEVWEKIRYQYNRDSDTVEQERLGSFRQFPIRLAWAITIHKSQGLTFDKAIIDAGESFAPGQVYVALSRLTTLDGLVLKSRISAHTIHTDPKIVAFAGHATPESQLAEALRFGQQQFVQDSLVKAFSFGKLQQALEEHYRGLSHKHIPDKQQAITAAGSWYDAIRQSAATARKFTSLLDKLFAAIPVDYVHLAARTAAAVQHFREELNTALLAPVKAQVEEVKKEKKAKAYTQELLNLQKDLARQLQLMEQALQVAEGLTLSDEELLLRVQKLHEPKPVQTQEQPAVAAVKKAPKGETGRITLQYFKEGKTIEEIAALRNLAVSTVTGHLIDCIPSGEVEVLQFVSQEKLDVLLKMFRTEPQPPGGLTAIRNKLGDAYTYTEIKAGMKAWEMQGKA